MIKKDLFKLNLFPKTIGTEVDIVVTGCKYPANCNCLDSEVAGKCGYDPKDIQTQTAEYYERKAQYIRNQNMVDFLHDHGYYYTQGELNGTDDTITPDIQRTVRKKNSTVSKK